MTITPPLHPGRATPEATKAYAEKVWRENPKISPNSWRLAEGLTVGKIGYGSYRLSGAPHERVALHAALLGGCNVIDTASNYMDGASEEVLGHELRQLFDQGLLARDAVVVMAKGGYIQGRLYQSAVENPPAEVVDLAPGLWHCLHPDFIRRQIDTSRQRLGLATLDFYLLHNPEYYLDWAAARGTEVSAARAEYYRRLTQAFVALERAAQEGEIAYYGISSNTLVAPADDPLATDLARVYEAAESAAAQVWGRKKRPLLRAIQLPMNLLELGALKEANTQVKRLAFEPNQACPVLELAAARHLSVFVNRPLNAFGPQGAWRLAEPKQPGVAIDQAARALQQVEMQVEKTLGGWPTTDAGHPLLRLGDEAAALAEQTENSLHFDQIQAGLLLPHAAGVVQRLNEAQHNPLIKNYVVAWQGVQQALRDAARAADQAQTAPLKQELQRRLPPAWQAAPLQQVALNAIASVPGVTTVLCGLRQTDYVTDVTQVYERGDFVDPAQVIGAPTDFIKPQNVVGAD